MSTYTVRRGDCLSTIANHFHTSLHALEQANPKVHNPNRIYVGEKLQVPGQSAKHPAQHPSHAKHPSHPQHPSHPKHPAHPKQPSHPKHPTHSTQGTHASHGGNSKVNKMLDVARHWIGYHEGPNNSNRFSHAMGRPSEAWCADFVSYCAKQAGIHSVNTASAQMVQNQLAAKHQWKGKHNPQPGDAVTFDWSGRNGWADHVGLVEKTFHKNGHLYIQTIEGNSSDGVHRRTYLASSAVIKGYGRMV